MMCRVILKYVFGVEQRSSESMDKKRGVKSSIDCRVFIFLSLLLFPILFYITPASAWDAEFVNNPSEEVTLNAERVSYDDEAGKAVAEGNAVMTYQGATIRAERIDYDVFSNKVMALSKPSGSVLLNAMGRTVTGSDLEYDLNTQEGTLNGVRSDLQVGSGTLHIAGDGMQTMPYELAQERGLVGSGAKNASYIGIAENVTATTCSLPHPHYRIETKSIIFIPGQRLVAKNPRLYLGNTFLFTYPLDYIVLIDNKAMKHHIMPYVQSSDKKGAGIGLEGGIQWETWAVSLGMAYWSKTGLEWMAGIEKSFGGGLSFEGSVEYTWNEAWEERQYSPRIGLYYARDGWEAALRMTWNEYQEIQKDANYEYRGRLNRKPEFTVMTPWMRDPTLNLSWFRLGAEAGSYCEETPLVAGDSVTRYGASLQSYFEYPLGGVTFFSNNTYSAWFYDEGDSDQAILDSFLGFRYNLGAVELASGYERRHIWGESPMLWDRFFDRERFHQRIRFPLGQSLFLSARGSYDLDASYVDEVNYSLQWLTDCMSWELRYRDDRTSGSNTNINLSVSILAYPNTPLSFGESRSPDPFEPPILPDETIR